MPTSPQAPAPTPADEAASDLQTQIETLSKIGNVANVNDLVLGLSPAIAASSLYISNAQSLGILYENAVAAQKQQSELAPGALQAGLAQMRKVTTDGTAAAVSKIDPDKDVIDLLETIKKLV